MNTETVRTVSILHVAPDLSLVYGPYLLAV